MKRSILSLMILLTIGFSILLAHPCHAWLKSYHYTGYQFQTNQRSYIVQAPENTFYVLHPMGLENPPSAYLESCENPFVSIETPLDLSGFIVSRIKPSGEIIWSSAYDFSPEINSNPYNAVMSNDRGELFFGIGLESQEEIFSCESTPPIRRRRSIQLVKVGNDGNLLWKKSYTHPDFFSSIYVWKLIDMGRGEVVLLARYSSDGVNSRPLIIRLDSEGNVQWSKSIQLGSVTVLKGGSVDGSGNLLLVGNTGIDSTRSNDLIIMKMDGAGNFIWQKVFAGTDFDEALFIEKDSADGWVLMGRTSSIVGAPVRHIWFLKVDSLGNLIWQKGLRTRGGSVPLDFVKKRDDLFVGLFYSDADYNTASVGLDGSGNILWQTMYPSVYTDRIIASQEGFLALGSSSVTSDRVIFGVDSSGYSLLPCNNNSFLLPEFQVTPLNEERVSATSTEISLETQSFFTYGSPTEGVTHEMGCIEIASSSKKKSTLKPSK